MQTITITGNVGKDPALRSTQNGDQVLGFNVAVKQGFGDRATTNWFRVSVWGKRGETLNRFVRKGTYVTVQGELTIGEYEGKPQFDVRANEVDFVNKDAGQNNEQRSGGNRAQEPHPGAHGGDAMGDDWDSVPF